MVLQVEINDEQLENMSEKAKEELVYQLSTYAESIIKEANLIEEGNREGGANQEIISSMVVQAVRKYKNKSPRKKEI